MQATDEESRAGDAIARNVAQVAEMAEANRLAIGETTADTHHLSEIASRLNNLVGQFKV